MMLLKTLVAILLIVFISCQQTQKISTSLLGRWILDSTSGRGGKIIPASLHREFTLQRDGSFTFKWSDFDVSGDYYGKYAYDNTDTKSGMLIFLIYSPERKDSVIRKDSIMILNLTDSILRTQEKESYMTLDSIIITQNRTNVYM